MASFVVPDPVPSAAEDAKSIRKAVHGLGTDEKALIKILAHRNAAQRKQIRLAYEELYKEDLIKRLESELSGDFEKAVYRWILEPADRASVLANVALRSPVKYQVIVEIACVVDPDELLAVKRAYQSRYKRSLEEDVASHTSGDVRKILLALVGTYRYNGNEVNPSLAASEANILRDAIQRKVFNHEEIVRILSTRSKAQLNATFNRYKDANGISITKNLLVDPADEFLGTLATTIRCINNSIKYFEKVLCSAINKKGTDEDALTRVIVTHAEKDMNVIKELYYKRNSVALDKAVAKEISGDYKAFLLASLPKH